MERGVRTLGRVREVGRGDENFRDDERGGEGEL